MNILLLNDMLDDIADKMQQTIYRTLNLQVL